MVNARDSHGNAYGPFISPEGWRTLAGGNTPGNRPTTLRPGGALESIVGYPIRPISPICPIPLHHPQTNPHPKSTLANPKSTVDLGCEPLIRVENGLRPPLSPTCYRPISGPKLRESNQNQTVTNQKILSRVAAPMAVPKDCCGVRSCASTGFKDQILKAHSSLLQSIQAFLPPSGGHMMVVTQWWP